jgi:predicted Zn-dependent protease
MHLALMLRAGGKRLLLRRIAACAATPILLLGLALPAQALTRQEQDEVQIGQQVYRQLERQGKILTESPDYAVLAPIGKRIAIVADKRYFAPAHFILIREKQPNAFAVPGGNVYVTDSMMKFVQNKEQLAGVLCHEVSHNIHHDVYDLYVKGQRVALWATLAQILLGGRSQLTSFAIDFLANVQALRFSRAVERSADETGAYICAESVINPWGMVWLMKHFTEQPTGNPPEFLSDHPTDSHRMADLQRQFEEHPAVFGEFNPDRSSATPLAQEGFRDPYRAKPAPPPAPSAR